MLETTNELTAAFGPSPIAAKGMSPGDATGGFIVYIEIDAQRQLRIRQFYANYGVPGGFNNQSDFETAVIKAAKLPEVNGCDASGGFDRADLKIPETRKRGPFPNILRDDLDEVEFGLSPRNVTYILDGPGYRFLSPAATNPEDAPAQPSVLRKSKAVRQRDGSVCRVDYKYENDTFFNLTVDNSNERVAFLRFVNNMTGANEADPRDYCMDIYIDLPTDKGNSAGKGTNNWLTIVFDPPIINGGNGGPP